MSPLIPACLFYYFLAGIGVVIGYHRHLNHPAFAIPRWLSYSLIILGLPAGTPIQWAVNYRFHPWSLIKSTEG